MAARIIQVKVTPRSRVSSLTQAGDGTWMAKLKSPPVDGKANAELIALVAEQFGCTKGAVSIKTGVSGRMKLVRIDAAPTQTK
jgi:uncharacterized protein (TIGR00251 family)